MQAKSRVLKKKKKKVKYKYNFGKYLQIAWNIFSKIILGTL